MSGLDLSQFLASFFDEARERLASINHALVRFEAGALDEEGMVALRRDAHTIKGSALMLGVQDVGDIAHLFEDAVDFLIRNPDARTPSMTQFLFDLHDHLAQRLQDPESDFRLDVPPLRQRFEKLKKEAAEETSAKAHRSAAASQEGGSADESENASPMIGAEEAQRWREERVQATDLQEEPLAQAEKKEEGATQAAISVEPPGAREEMSDQAGERETAGMIKRKESLLDDPDNFRPDISQIEMKGTVQRHSSGRFLRVDADRLEQLSNQVIELSTQKGFGASNEKRLDALMQGMRTLQGEWRTFAAHLSEWNEGQRQQAMDAIQDGIAAQMRLARTMIQEFLYQQTRTYAMLDELRDRVLALMLQPLSSIFVRFPRAVRDVAMRCGKKVRLALSGESVEVDRGVAEALVEPLVHLLNNAVAHGIEAPDVRLRKGKPEEGQVTILARQSGSEIIIEVIDDGQGLDPEVIRKAAVERGVTTEAEAAEMDRAEILELIFRPGFSTRSEADHVSGRGIGMNVVQDTVRKLTGSVRIHSQPGKGTRFTLSLPVSIAVQHALLFRIGDQRLGLLTHMIEQIVPLHRQKIEPGPGKKDFIRYGKDLVPLVDLRESLLEPGHEMRPSTPYVIIAEHIEGFVGIVVDELFDEQEIIVRDLDPYLKRYQTVGLMANTITADGSVLLLIEPYGIKEMGRTAPDALVAPDAEAVPESLRASDLRVLLVDDSIIARKVEIGLLESLGFTVDGAIDGVDAMEKMQLADYDIVITDLEMPRLDGFGLVRQLRNDPKYEGLPILVISTRESPEDRMRAIEAGADAYLVKQQLNGEELIKSIQALMGPLTQASDDSRNRPSEA